MTQIQQNLTISFNEPIITPSIETELKDVYKTFSKVSSLPLSGTKNIRLVDAISEGLKQAMLKNKDRLIVIPPEGSFCREMTISVRTSV